MCFFDKNKYLVSVGVRLNSPILVYSMKNYRLLLSTLVQEQVQDLFPVQYFCKQDERRGDRRFVTC